MSKSDEMVTMAVTGGVALLALGTVAMLARPDDEGAPEGPGPGPALLDEPDGRDDWPTPSSRGWSAEADNQRTLELAQAVVDLTGWLDLPAFLLAKSFTESRGNPEAGAWTEDNRARGLLGMRPRSAFAYELEHLRSNPNLLHDRRWSIAMAAWYGYRIERRYKAPRQVVDWLAMARGWAYPRLVADVDEVAVVNVRKPGTDPPRNYYPGERSAVARERFEIALAKAGLTDSFMYARAIPPGFDWPGIGPVLQAVGLTPPLS